MDPAWEHYCAGYDKQVNEITARLIRATTLPDSTPKDLEITRLAKELERLYAKMTLAEDIRSKKLAPA
jgi:hypothetical protein